LIAFCVVDISGIRELFRTSTDINQIHMNRRGCRADSSAARSKTSPRHLPVQWVSRLVAWQSA
jgi:hypothetical protein